MGSFCEVLRRANLNISKSILNHRGKNILFFDYCNAYDKYKFLKNVAPLLYPDHLICVDLFNSSRKEPNFENITSHYTPTDILFWRTHELESNGDIEIDLDKFENIIDLYFYHVKYRVENYDKNLVIDMIQDTYLYSLFSIQAYHPEFVIIWNMFHPLSKVAEIAAKECGKPVLWAEFGLFPNTITFEFTGQVGKSFMARNQKAYDSFLPNEGEIEDAREYLEHLRTEKQIMRHASLESKDLYDKVKKLANGKPIIFYAGHNELTSGVYPYDEDSRRYHSPIFKTSQEAVKYLLDLCQKNDFFLLYKPHPLFDKDDLSGPSSNFYKCSKADINECIRSADLTCTVLSQTSYLDLIQNKPVLMLGINQLNNKGIGYEANTIEEIETQVKKGLHEKLTLEQLKNWEEHVAKILYYSNTFTLDETQNLKKIAKSANDFVILYKDFLANGIYSDEEILKNQINA